MNSSRLPRLFLLGLFVGPSALRGADRDAPARRDLPKERAEWNASLRRDREGRLLAENRLRALDEACAMPVDAAMAAPPAGRFERSSAGPSLPSAAAPATFPGLSWRPLGPRPMKSVVYTNADFGSLAGRITALALHPKDSSTMLLGAATGGIWKSSDSGATFRPVSDTAPALATSAISYAPSNPSVVYAATGEADSADLEFLPSRSLGTYLGAGLLKSVDGGESWRRVDVDLPGGAVLSRVVVHPSDPNRVLVGVYVTQDLAANGVKPGGLFRSTDGGVHFTKVFAHAVADLVPDPDAPDGVFAAFGVTGGCASCPDPSGVYRSTDFGATWAPSLVPSTPGALFTSPTGNIKLGVSGKKPAVVYASILSTDDAHDSGTGIYRSTDGGATWARRLVDGTMCPPPPGYNQCSYDHFITPSPSEPDVVYFGAVDLYKSTDGAASWTHLTDVYQTGGSVHPDQHAGVVPPNDARTLVVGNDGGLYRTTDGGLSFENLSDTLTLAQFNGIALHPSDGDFAMGGTQDNGNQRFQRSYVWTDRTGGDGGFNLIRKDRPAEILSAEYFAYMHVSTDGGETFADATSCDVLMDCASGAPREPMAFYPPATAAPAAPETTFFGAQRVYANTTFGKTATGWSARSATAFTTSRIYALEVVGDGSGPIWAGTSSGAVYFSTDGGATFADRSAGLPGTVVTRIAAVSPDGKSAYVTLGGFSGAPSRHVFRTTDGGASWANVSANLPDAPVLSIAVDPSDPNDLFVGTDVGVFRSPNAGASWVSFNAGLPNVSVTSLAFQPSSGDLWASTYGRGAFRIARAGTGLLPPLADFAASPAVPAPGESVAFLDRTYGAPASWLWDFGDGTAPVSGASPRHAYAQSGSYPVTLTATNAAGSSTKTLRLNVVSGAISPVTLQVPVVLDVFGVGGSHFTSDLVAVNRSASSTRLTVQYLASPGTPGAGGPRLGLTLPKGRELRLGDVVAFLRANGYAMPPSGTAIVGTLRLTFEDVDDPTLVFAGSRTSTPNPNASVGGSFGLFSNAAPASAAIGASAVLTALDEDARFRTNLAIVDVPGGSGASRLSIQLYDGDGGAPAGDPIPYSLQAGEWHQFGSILQGAGVKNGWAVVTKTGGGSNRFLAYAVVNDGASSGGGTSDGSFVSPDADQGLVPIVLRVASGGTLYTSELVLTNTTSSPATVTLTYTPASVLGGGAVGTATVSLGAYRQLRVPDAIAYLRDTLGLPLAPGNANQGGTLRVSGALAYVRTSNPNPDAAVGGTFGLAYPAISAARRAHQEAWVYGLVQDEATRSNLAVADARVGDSSAVTYRVDLFDADGGDGTTPAASTTVSLRGGEWTQLTKVLAGTGLTHAYARISPESAASDYVTYGVLNDGANPGERTSDGSYVAMSGVR